MDAINIYDKNKNLWIDDDLLDELGDTYVEKNPNGLKEKYGITLEKDIFERFHFEEFVHYAKWLLQTRGFKTSNKKNENY